jgi:phosphomannomutase
VGDLASIVKAYDIRGVVPDQLDEGVAEAVGAAFVRVTGASTVVTVHDMRPTSGPLADAFGRGAASAGANVLASGLGSTDMLYYASGDRGIPGAMITASHNPARYNGIKLCRAGAKPVGIETGLQEIKDLAERTMVPADRPGTISTVDLLPGYADHLKKLVDISGIRPLKVVVDAGNGMAGYTVPKVFEGLPITLIPMYFELDGTRTTRRTPLTPPTWWTCSGPWSSTKPTSGWPSTVTPTGASWWTSAARSSRPRSSPR